MSQPEPNRAAPGQQRAATKQPAASNTIKFNPLYLLFIIVPALLFAIWGYTHIEGGGSKHLVNALGYASFGALVGLYLGFTFMLAVAWADDGKGGTPGLVWRYPLVIVGLLLLFALELFTADSSSTGISSSATSIPGGFCALLALAAVFVAIGFLLISTAGSMA